NQEKGSEPVLTSESEFTLASEVLQLQRLYSFRSSTASESGNIRG
ncbi:hypothetical protein A2U01_0115377, partial [Trifolium medium]|nr:hypothetical protein [Trifolium medium]